MSGWVVGVNRRVNLRAIVGPVPRVLPRNLLGKPGTAWHLDATRQPLPVSKRLIALITSFRYRRGTRPPRGLPLHFEE
jgi:hypothetical protein